MNNFISEITEKELKKKIEGHNKLVKEVNLLSILFAMPAYIGLEVISQYSKSNGVINFGLPNNFNRHLNSLLGAAAISIWLNGLYTFYTSYETKVYRHFYRILKKYDKKSEESLLKTIKETKNPFYSLLMETTFHVKRKDYDKAMLCLSRYSQISKKYGNPQTFFEKIAFMTIPKGLGFLLYFSKGLDEEILVAGTNFTLGKEERALKRINNLITKNPGYSTELSLLAGIWHNNLGKRDEAKPYFKKSLDEILKKGKENFNKVADSKNEVLEYNAVKFLNDSLIFKRSSNEIKLAREARIIDLHRKSYQENVFEASLNPLIIPVEENLGFFGENPMTLVLKRINDETLESILDKNNHDLRNEFKLSITNLVKLMAFSTPCYKESDIEDVPYDYGSEFKRRVIDRLGSSKFTENYFKEISKIKELTDKLNIKVLSHRDASDVNLLAGGYIIDFETAGYADPILDIATITACLDNEKAFSLFDQGYLELIKYFKIEKDLAFELFKKIRVHNALGQMSARLERGSDKDIKKAKKLYRIVKESQNNDFIEYLRNSKYCLSLE